MRSKFLTVLFISLVIFTTTAHAESPALKSFISGSYQQLLKDNTGKPFMLAIWSITCPSCIKDMAVLSAVHKAHPDVKVIMLSTDELTDAPDAQKILEKNQLAEVENWIYAEENMQKLQFEIDPKWYGELPRTYFFDKTHQREGISGVLSKADYEARINKILK
jgi:thiol-disulfide isomerase/thioredoxin